MSITLDRPTMVDTPRCAGRARVVTDYHELGIIQFPLWSDVFDWNLETECLRDLMKNAGRRDEDLIVPPCVAKKMATDIRAWRATQNAGFGCGCHSLCDDDDRCLWNQG